MSTIDQDQINGNSSDQNANNLDINKNSIYPSGFSHSFDSGIACSVGINAAIVLNWITFWIIHNHNRSINIHHGKAWVYHTQKKLSLDLPYFSEDQINYAIQKLVDHGLLDVAQLADNPFDRTNYYTLKDYLYLKITGDFQKSLSKTEISGIDGGNFRNRDRNRPESDSVNLRDHYIESNKESYDDDRGKVSSFSGDKCDSSDVKYKDASGKNQSISLSAIYLHFARSKFSTEVLKEAIDRARNAETPITNILKYIETTAKNIITTEIAKENKSKKDKKPTIDLNDPNRGPEQNTTTLKEAIKQMEERKKRCNGQ